MQMVASAARQLALSASDPSSPSQHLPSYLHSMDLPVSPPSPAQTPPLPPVSAPEPVTLPTSNVSHTEAQPACTPRMIEILSTEGDLANPLLVLGRCT